MVTRRGRKAASKGKQVVIKARGKPGAVEKRPAKVKKRAGAVKVKARRPKAAAAKRVAPKTSKASPLKASKTELNKTVASKTDSASLGPGSLAPEFDLTDQQGAPVSSSSLRGQPYVLYFYPKDDTPGCTVEACDFRDQQAGFARAGVKVFGVSPDSEGSHEKFAQKFDLNFTLLADPDKVLAQKYGVWAMKKNYGQERMGIVRSTFLLDGDGKVQKVWRGVKVAGHVSAVLEAAQHASAQ